MYINLFNFSFSVNLKGNIIITYSCITWFTFLFKQIKYIV